MAHGLPIVSTRCPGVQEAVVDEQSALLAEPNDVEGVASRVLRLLADERLSGRLGVSATERARERFDREANLPTVVNALLGSGLVAPQQPAEIETERERVRVLA
jgi:glycosyltransferase involved in cell wall biosynthesis